MASTNGQGELFFKNNNVPPGIRNLFIEFAKPCNVLSQFLEILSKKETENVMADTKNKGDTEGAESLLMKLVEKPNWFAQILKSLRHTDVKLKHIADMMEDEQRIFERPSNRHSGRNGLIKIEDAPSVASLYIKCTKCLFRDIRHIFTKYVNPEDVIPIIRKISDKVLTQVDVENVKAEFQNRGTRAAASLLLERLVLYDDWFTVLKDVLADPAVRLSHAVETILTATSPTWKWYAEETEKLPMIHPGESSHDNVQPKQVVTHSSGDAEELGQGRTQSTARVSEECETDAAEMKSEDVDLSQFHEMAISASQEQAQAGASVDMVGVSGKTVLMSATGRGNKSLLKSLVEKTSDIDACDEKGRTALMYAAVKGQTECLEHLICSRCDVNKADVDGNTALMMATKTGNVECMRLLIYARASVDAANVHGVTAVMIAACKGHGKCMELLLDAGCSPDKLHKDGKTALMYAAHRGHFDCVQLLIDRHCDLDKFDEEGFTALIYAAKEGHSKCLELLVDGGADVDKSDTKGNPALTWAIVNNQMECVKLLIHKNADFKIVNSFNVTPLTVAKLLNLRAYVRIIKRAAKLLRTSTG